MLECLYCPVDNLNSLKIYNVSPNGKENKSQGHESDSEDNFVEAVSLKGPFQAKRRLHVSGFGQKDTFASHLEEIFAKYGKIRSCKILK